MADPPGNGSLYMVRLCIHLLMQKSAAEPGDFRDLISHLFTYAASSGGMASAEVSSLLQTMLQKTSFRPSKLSRHDDIVNRWYKVHETFGWDVLALWELGYLWALEAFLHAHERPLLMASTIDVRYLPNVEFRDYDLLILAASSGCLEYTARNVAAGVPVAVSGRRPLLIATLQGVVTLSLRGIHYKNDVLLKFIGGHAHQGRLCTCLRLCLVFGEAVSNGYCSCLRRDPRMPSMALRTSSDQAAIRIGNVASKLLWNLGSTRAVPIESP